MSKSSYPSKLPHSIKEEAQRLAKADGVSDSVPADMIPILDQVPDIKPMEGNERCD